MAPGKRLLNLGSGFRWRAALPDRPRMRDTSAWIDRVAEAAGAYPHWDSAVEKSRVQGRLSRAQAVFTGLEASAAQAAGD